jgi:hypothetical protein
MSERHVFNLRLPPGLWEQLKRTKPPGPSMNEYIVSLLDPTSTCDHQPYKDSLFEFCYRCGARLH